MNQKKLLREKRESSDFWKTLVIGLIVIAIVTAGIFYFGTKFREQGWVKDYKVNYGGSGSEQGQEQVIGKIYYTEDSSEENKISNEVEIDGENVMLKNSVISEIQKVIDKVLGK